MERRDFLKASAVLTAGSTAAGCAHQGTTAATSSLPESELRHQLSELEANLNSVSESADPKTLLRSVYPDGCDESNDDGEHYQQCIRSLLVSGLYSQLSDDDKNHPAVQARMMAAMPEISGAIDGTLERLEALTSTQLNEIQQQLQDDPGVTQRILGALTTQAAAADIPRRRVRQMQTMADRFAWRMAKQHPSLVVREYTDKARRSQRKVLRSPKLQQQVAVALGEHALWVEDGRSKAERFAEASSRREPAKIPTPPTLPASPQAAPTHVPAPERSTTPSISTTPTRAPAVTATQHCASTTGAGGTAEEIQAEIERIQALRRDYRTGNAQERRTLLVSGGWLIGIGVVSAGFAPVTFGISATVGGILLIIGIILLGIGGARGRLKA